MKIVIIGNGPAAIKAVSTMAEFAGESKLANIDVTLISAEAEHAYSPMFLVEYLTGKLNKEQLLLPDVIGLPVEKLLGRRVTGVADAQNKIILDNGELVKYDKLLIASGASPIIPPIEGLMKEGVYFINRMADAEKLREGIKGADNIIIVGAGFIGIELAVALQELGKRVVVVEMLDHVLPQVMDSDMAVHVEREIASRGISFRLGTSVSAITGKGQATGLAVGSEEIGGDIIIIATGVEPNIDLLTSSNVKFSNGVLVNEKMQTNIPNIYAAGDIAEAPDPYHDYELAFNYYNAVDQGLLAGKNLIGIKDSYQFSPCLGYLKGVRTPVISIGRKYEGVKYETLSRIDRSNGIYERFFLRSDVIDCYQGIGVTEKVGSIYQCIKNREYISQFKEMLLTDNFHLANFMLTLPRN